MKETAQAISGRTRKLQIEEEGKLCLGAGARETFMYSVWAPGWIGGRWMDRDQGLSPLPKLHESSQCRMVPKARPPEHKPGGGIIPGACQLWQCTRLAIHALARRQWHGGRALGRLRGRHGHSRDHRWRTRTPAELPDRSLVGSRGPCAIFQGRRGRAKQSRPACFAFARANGARQAGHGVAGLLAAVCRKATCSCVTRPP